MEESELRYSLRHLCDFEVIYNMFCIFSFRSIEEMYLLTLLNLQLLSSSSLWSYNGSFRWELCLINLSQLTNICKIIVHSKANSQSCMVLMTNLILTHLSCSNHISIISPIYNVGCFFHLFPCLSYSTQPLGKRWSLVWTKTLPVSTSTHSHELHLQPKTVDVVTGYNWVWPWPLNWLSGGLIKDER